MSQEQTQASHPMKKIGIEKVVVNIGVGKSGEPLEKARHALLELTGCGPSITTAKKTIRDFGIHKREPIGALVTLRRDKGKDFLKRVIAAKGNILRSSSFDEYGNISIGIHEHIDIPGTKYNPDIGIFGMDVSISLSRPGYRIARKRDNTIIGKSHRISKVDALEFFRREFGVEIV
jgi:large subunit ribosomal protein L5